MGKKAVIALAVLVLVICILSGGCKTPAEEKQRLESWKDLLKKATEVDQTRTNRDEPKAKTNLQEVNTDTAEKTTIKLYFGDLNNHALAVETRNISKTEAIGRKTLAELIKGPRTAGLKPVFPAQTSLRDINIKPDGSCIIDLSSEATRVDNVRDEKIMVYAMANTLGQFPTVKEISFMVDGQKTDKLAGFMDLSQPVKPDYNITF
ncbi:GerMN domain-containing protein [Syntrophomonas palmitatica]|uniref:GerMN domain-containing protein n=1 Tax=Syntrophomonas palmitatica TaxID=402877 RepID=UPI0006D1D616|nr:GerMN domain-containing protein [Syntrophomonas palmitatica]